MLVPVLLTIGIAGLMYASRASSPFVQSRAIKFLDVVVDPFRYGSNPPGYDGKKLECGNDPACDAAAVLTDLGWEQVALFSTSDGGLSKFKAGKPVTLTYRVTGSATSDQIPPWMTYTFSDQTPAVTSAAAAPSGIQPQTMVQLAPPRVGQAFQGTISAEVTFKTHAEIDAWLQARLRQIDVDCSNEHAGNLARTRAADGKCGLLLYPSLIFVCLLENGRRWREAEAQTDDNCNVLRDQARAYAQDAHARLDARIRAAIQSAARVPVASAPRYLSTVRS
jgi:hypothetical protein